MPNTRNRPAALPIACCLLALGAAAPTAHAAEPPDAAALLERVRAHYAALHSYADSGTLVTEIQLAGGPAVVERHTFTTRYRAPRQFWFDWNEDPAAGGDRFVVWGDGGDLNTWWLTTGAHDVYPPGRGAIAFALASYPTGKSINLVPPLLFAGAGLSGPLHNLTGARLGQIETISGRACQEILAINTSEYKTGRGAENRPTRVYVDPVTLLVCRVIEETPPHALPGSTNRTTTTFEATADPQLAGDAFAFTPDGSPRR